MKELKWLGDSLSILCEFPEEVKSEFGYGLYETQLGFTSRKAKPLANIGNGVMEIISDFDKNSYRVIYTAKIGATIYVLHCFQKKSKKGIATPKHTVELIKKRLKLAYDLEKMEITND